MHADHITGSSKLKQLIPGVKSVISQASGAKADIFLQPSDRINFGQYHLKAFPTPGHTDGIKFVNHDT